MRAILAGAGALGREVAQRLISQGHDVTVIERDEEVCQAIYAELGVIAVHGSATDLRVLADAGTAEADVVATLLHSDADNIACALLSRSMGVEQVIANLRDPVYEQAYKAAGVTHMVHATRLLGNQIALHVQHPEVGEIAQVGRHEAEVFSVEVPSGAVIHGMNLAELARLPGFPRECLVVGLARPGQTSLLIPRGGDRVHEGDTLNIFSRPSEVGAVLALVTRRR